MTTFEQTETLAGTRVAEAAPHEPRPRGDLWWRYLVSLLAIAFALFPAVYVVSAAFSAVPSLSTASPIPRSFTLENFREILTNPPIAAESGERRNVHYGNWYVNSMVVSSAAALFTVMLGALAAYAFSRFRFKGRRLGMLALLLIQMFPQFLAIVAIYLILLRMGDIFPVIGLNSLTGLIVVYLGGALGVNAWLMKGFFDSIPAELDESARVDGATPAQVFWGIILPLGAPVLAVVGLLSFINTMNEYIIASRLLQGTTKFTLPVGMYGFISDQYGQRWGPFCAGVVLAAIPVVVLFLFLQRFIVHGLTSGSVKG
jgi:arabinogalactan oligomer/maltooligosaccharide transport system permease protein